LPAGLGKRQVPELIEHNEVFPAKILGQTALPPGAAFRLQLVDQIDDIEEPAAGTIADASARDRNGKMRLPCASRTRGILPNITTPMGGSFIGITLATVRAWKS